MLDHVNWQDDILDGFESLEIPLPEAARAPGESDEIEVVATLVRRAGGERSEHAVLYLHGWNDYFFQTHVADALSARRLRLLRPRPAPLRAQSAAGSAARLHRGSERVRPGAERGRRPDRARITEQLTLMGHSTGGLTATLWAADHPDRVAGVILNSPWLDLQGSAMVRALGGPVIDALGREPADGGAAAAGLRLLRADDPRRPGGGVGLRHRAEDEPLAGHPGGLAAGGPAGAPEGRRRSRAADAGAGDDVDEDRLRPQVARRAPRRPTPCSTSSRSPAGPPSSVGT